MSKELFYALLLAVNVAYSAGETELHDVMLVVYIIHVTVHRKVFIIYTHTV